MKTDMTSSATIYRSENVQRYFNDIRNPKYNPIEDRLVRELFADREMFKDIIIISRVPARRQTLSSGREPPPLLRKLVPLSQYRQDTYQATPPHDW